MKQNYNRSIKLVCVTCGSDSSFSTDAQTGIITCKKCNRVYYGGKDELIELNQELIEANIEDIKKEAVKEFEKELSKVLKKWR